MKTKNSQTSSVSKLLKLDDSCCFLPEKLLLAHGRGEVLFVTGAGTSIPAGLPDFRGLALKIYERLDRPLYTVLERIERTAYDLNGVDTRGLEAYQVAEARRFAKADYDVALGMLERRIDKVGTNGSQVRRVLSDIVRDHGNKHANIHRSLISLADRGGTTTIVTTNFDLLLEQAAKSLGRRLESYSLSSIPRPGRSTEFEGVMHIHGALDHDPERLGDCIVTDQDFGEFYLRRQVVPDFIYDAARLFQLVLVGYSASDPPMRYLLNAVAADNVRFTDLRERYAFVPYNGEQDPVTLSDWRSRGIEPIPYDDRNHHSELANTLSAWSNLSAVNGSQKRVDTLSKRLVAKSRDETTDERRDLFDHLYRRASDVDRGKLTMLVSNSGAGCDWLNAMLEIDRERGQEKAR